MHTLRVVPFSVERTDLLTSLYQSLSGILKAKVDVENNPINFEDSFNPDRNQYHSTVLIRHLLSLNPDTEDKILGITSLDLYIPILTFVFGEAQLKGTAAVVSSFRLRSEFYGLPPDDQLLEERLLKESVHELGHTYGLIHCPFYECVMHSSTSVEEIDIKGADFCHVCQKTLLTKRAQAPD